jgi:aromatic ring-opening dioxygenase catalytic subunit (LigB family)
MGQIVFAAGAPHAPAIVGLFDRAPADSQKVVKDTYTAITQELKAAQPDVLIVFANDHLANSRITLYPDFLIGTAAQHSGPHEWFQEWIGCRDYSAKGNPDVAKALFQGMTRRGIRMSSREENLKFDDNISVPVVMTDLDRTDITLVPVLQNCTVPPFPSPEKCYEVGKALRDFIEQDLPKDMRVALFGSGGLSHEPGGVKYYKIDEAFDRAFLDLCVKGDHKELLKEITVERLEEAGIGGTAELLSWFPVMAAIGERPGRSFGYTGWPSFRCGVGGVIWDLEAKQ